MLLLKIFLFLVYLDNKVDKYISIDKVNSYIKCNTIHLAIFRNSDSKIFLTLKVEVLNPKTLIFLCILNLFFVQDDDNKFSRSDNDLLLWAHAQSCRCSHCILYLHLFQVRHHYIVLVTKLLYEYMSIRCVLPYLVRTRFPSISKW